MLPGCNGFEVLKKIRKQSNVPVLMLTARSDEVDRIVGLEIGADDYLGKPFNPRELVARIRAIFRRTQTQDGDLRAADEPSKWWVDDIALELHTRRVFKQGQAHVILMELPAGLVQLLFQMYYAIALRFAAALMASGLICFLMVKYLTSPIRKLQAAVRRFAQGDLRVRVAAEIGSRQDEIADLGRDFDIMAARIESLMHSAIENVVRNALRFTPIGSQVEITQAVRKDKGKTMVVLVISDKGPGVPQEALKDLFNPFFRVADKPGRTSGGAGIGLAIAFHAVSLHRGTISATNRSGGGLTVEISLPIEEGDIYREKQL